MSDLRALLRLTCLVAVTLLIVLVAMPAHALAWFARTLGLRRTGELFSLHLQLLLQSLWSRSLLVVLGVRVRTSGTPPAGCWVIASNHLGYLDIPVLASVLRCRFIAKSEVRGWPIVGPLSTMGRVLFVDRGRPRDVLAVGRSIRETLDAGVSVAFFPEGTSTRGDAVASFRSALLEPAAEQGIACLPVAIRYETPGESIAPAWTICWWGDMTFLPHVWRLMKVRCIEATVEIAPVPLRGNDRKVLARRLEAGVTAMFRPVRQEPAPDEACAETGLRRPAVTR